MNARVIECRPGRYCIIRDNGDVWGTSGGPLGYWWSMYKEYAKIWRFKSRAERQCKLLNEATKKVT